jgi:hypothetical protein
MSVVNTRLKGDLLFRCTCLPVPRNLYVPFINFVVKWVERSGEEWTIDRLKSIKLDLIRISAGLEPVSKWIRKGTSTHFGGVLAPIERRALSGKKGLNAIIQLLQVYSWFISRSLTQKQKQKFLDGVQSTPPSRESLASAYKVLDRGFSIARLRRVRYIPDPKPLLEFLPSSNRRAPLPDRSVPEADGIIDSAMFLWNSAKGRAHYRKFQPVYDKVMEGLDWWPTWIYKVSGPYGPLPDNGHFDVGRIGLIQEPGYKLRAVANPGRIFQQVLGPMGDTLYRTLRELPWDCTFDQSKGFPFIKDHLSHGGVAYSIDLSGATDYFPLDLQLRILRKIFPTSYVELFTDICQGEWEMPGFGRISWTRGQPLGLYPSFASFALTHGILLLGLAGSFQNQFYILGDDVVILDEELAHRYHSLLNDLQCPISESKSLVSSNLCEFGGKLITSTEVIPQFKWRQVSDNSFIDIVRNLGRRSVKILRTRQKHVIEKISFLPECLGGFGWNPQGLSIETRLNNAPWIFQDKGPRERTTSYTGSSITLLFKSESYRQTLKDVPNLVTTLRGNLDQRSLALTKKYLGSFMTPWYLILGKNLDEILTSNLLDCDLPIKDVRDQSDLLSQWERKIGKDYNQVGKT